MSSYSGTAAKTAKDVILSDPSTYYQWYENIKGSVPDQFWEYFDPESDADPEAIKPIKPIKPVNTPPTAVESLGPSTRNSRAATETPEQQASRGSQYEKRLDRYYQDFDIYKEEARQWEKYLDCKTKLRDRILLTVSQQKSARLVTSKSLREWITGLRDSTQPPKATVQMNIRVEYGRFMHQALGDWPSGGPSNWLAKWEDLICRAKQYDEPLRNWLMDVTLVWTNVHDLNVFFETVEFAIRKGDVAQYDQASISAEIQQCWEVKKQGSTLQLTKPKPTRSAFTAATFDGEEPPEAEDADVTFNGEEPPETEDADAEKGKQKKRSKKSERRKKRSRSRSPAPEDRTNRSDRKQSYGPCQACGGPNHSFRRCYLVPGQDKDKDWISEKARETFRNNMKVASFKKEVDKRRDEKKSDE